jgi:HYR domain
VSWPKYSVTDSDGIPPTISCPDDIVVENDPGECDYDVPKGEDNWCASTVLSSGLGSGAFFEVGTVHTETYTVEDAAGFTSSCSFTITVNDVEPPDASSVPGPNPSGIIPASNNRDGFWTVSATDIVKSSLLALQIRLARGRFFPGPFDADGKNIHYVKANRFSQKKGPGAVDFRLQGFGDAEVVAMDEAGNVDTVPCTRAKKH